MPAQRVHHLIEKFAVETPGAAALYHKKEMITYEALNDAVESFAEYLKHLNATPGERIAIYLPKQPETVTAIFAASRCHCVFVPLNPVLKPDQVAYILKDSGARILVTSDKRKQSLREVLPGCPDLQTVIEVREDGATTNSPVNGKPNGDSGFAPGAEVCSTAATDSLAGILYTSGSTGFPKGVMLSHDNMLLGAASVAQYLGKSQHDRLLAVLPLSFDYGLSQLTTAFSVGASVVLLEYLFPRDIIKAVEHYRVTGVAAIPTLWNQLARHEWPESTVNSLRYITNSGGTMPVRTTRRLRKRLPNTRIFLMYGFTEAFRSSYLPPEELDSRPDSIGIPIPNAQLYVLDKNGKDCPNNVPGELVHAGPLVALGYWKDSQRTAERFRPFDQQGGKIAAWSGDKVVRDEQGYLYFMGRMDEMIKTSGYRVSPSEIESVVHEIAAHIHFAALGLPHPELGEAIVLVLEEAEQPELEEKIRQQCRKKLPPYMQPAQILFLQSLPLNANGKIDRPLLHEKYANLFDSIQLST